MPPDVAGSSFSETLDFIRYEVHPQGPSVESRPKTHVPRRQVPLRTRCARRSSSSHSRVRAGTGFDGTNPAARFAAYSFAMSSKTRSAVINEGTSLFSLTFDIRGQCESVIETVVPHSLVTPSLGEQRLGFEALVPATTGDVGDMTWYGTGDCGRRLNRLDKDLGCFLEVGK
ncbi:hypothetical protein CCR75_005920 [Bremia lactucae]|uniref:Uncharacterized protein n=1 Tax=Bremia lactucae TaxID=4779 RepID=A0A976ILN8_BRELC|nr:hypothetical protein CCR75_005920 [Bremia lactucae]